MESRLLSPLDGDEIADVSKGYCNSVDAGLKGGTMLSTINQEYAEHSKTGAKCRKHH